MDEKYFEALKRTFMVTATTHGCEEIREGGYMPGYDDDSQEVFQQKQYFMYSVFNKVLQVTWENHSQEICTNFGCTVSMEGV